MQSIGRRAAWLAALAGALLAGCAQMAQPPAASADEFIAPNAQLVAQGIPPVPASLARTVARYTDFRGQRFVGWHPLQPEMLVALRPRGANTVQLHRLRGPQARPEQLTDGPDPVGFASWEPLQGRYIVFGRSVGGSEANQLYHLDPASRRVTLLTDTTSRHSPQGWLNKASRLLVSSVALDRARADGPVQRRENPTTRLSLIDPERQQADRLLAELPGTGWSVADVSRDDGLLALNRYLSASESEVWLLDLSTLQRQRVLPQRDADRAAWRASEFSADGRSLYVQSDHFGEFNELLRHDFGTSALTRITEGIAWDVGGLTQSADGSTIAVLVNAEGSGELRLFDTRTLKPLPVPPLPPGSLLQAQFHPQRNELALSVSSAQGPGQIHVLDLAGGASRNWSGSSAPPGLDTRNFAEQQIIRWKSFDGREISGLLAMPPAGFGGKRPVLINIHGGPEGQARRGFLGRANYFVQELGIALIQPNVRGSSGFGKTFLALDNGRLREDSVRDIGALLDWIATQPQLDASRVMVTGGSYGGYMSLAAAVHYGDRIAGAIDVVGISHFVTFLENTESYRRDLRRVEYGDERDPQMREFLHSISPLTNAHRIRKPLFVVQGRNDPRVPWTEAEQIVQRVRANGTPVWYLLAENEGHGFARKDNADFEFYATILFMQRYLLR
jgi:dipeptidyl aminopeptidase/acylaminoacyl peptidase